MAQVVETPGGDKLRVEISGAHTGHPVFLLHGTPGTLVGPRPRGIFVPARDPADQLQPAWLSRFGP